MRTAILLNSNGEWSTKMTNVKSCILLAVSMFAYCGGLCAVPSAAVLPAIPQDGTPYTEADNWDRIHPAL